MAQPKTKNINNDTMLNSEHLGPLGIRQKKLMNFLTVYLVHSAFKFQIVMRLTLIMSKMTFET